MSEPMCPESADGPAPDAPLVDVKAAAAQGKAAAKAEADAKRKELFDNYKDTVLEAGKANKAAGKRGQVLLEIYKHNATPEKLVSHPGFANVLVVDKPKGWMKEVGQHCPELLDDKIGPVDDGKDVSQSVSNYIMGRWWMKKMTWGDFLKILAYYSGDLTIYCYPLSGRQIPAYWVLKNGDHNYLLTPEQARYFHCKVYVQMVRSDEDSPYAALSEEVNKNHYNLCLWVKNVKEPLNASTDDMLARYKDMSKPFGFAETLAAMLALPKKEWPWKRAGAPDLSTCFKIPADLDEDTTIEELIKRLTPKKKRVSKPRPKKPAGEKRKASSDESSAKRAKKAVMPSDIEDDDDDVPEEEDVELELADVEEEEEEEEAEDEDMLDDEAEEVEDEAEDDMLEDEAEEVEEEDDDGLLNDEAEEAEEAEEEEEEEEEADEAHEEEEAEEEVDEEDDEALAEDDEEVAESDDDGKVAEDDSDEEVGDDDDDPVEDDEEDEEAEEEEEEEDEAE